MEKTKVCYRVFCCIKLTNLRHLSQWKRIVSKKRFRITLNLNQGKGEFRLLTSDLSEAYVDFNKSE